MLKEMKWGNVKEDILTMFWDLITSPTLLELIPSEYRFSFCPI